MHVNRYVQGETFSIAEYDLITIGADVYNSQSRAYIGDVARVRIFDKALNSSEVQSLCKC